MLYFKANERAIREARGLLPEEPLENEDTLTIRLRGPQGNDVRRTFYAVDTTEVILLLIHN